MSKFGESFISNAIDGITKLKLRSLKSVASINEKLDKIMGLEDRELLELIKRLDDNVLESTFENDGNDVSMLDLVIDYEKLESFKWLIKNKQLEIKSGYNTGINLYSNTLNDWSSSLVIPFFDYLLQQPTKENQKTIESFMNATLAHISQNANGSFLDVENIVDGFLDYSDPSFIDIMKIKAVANQIKYFIIMHDDSNTAEWVVKNFGYEWEDYFLIRSCVVGGSVNEYLRKQEEIAEYALSHNKDLNIDIGYWLTDELEDLFIF